MQERRTVLGGLIGLGLGTVTAGATAGEELIQPPADEADNQNTQTPVDKDRAAIMSAGLNEAEADCWKKAAAAAAAFFALPEQHPSDQQEVATAIHVLQNKLLSRPTYRNYLAEAKRLHGEE